MAESPLNAALRQFEAAEANLSKLENVLKEMERTIPEGIAFGDNLDYEDNRRSFEALWNSLPKIDGWKPEIQLMGLNEIAQWRFDAQEVGEIDAHVAVEREIGEPSRIVREYRFKFTQKRRELVRDSLIAVTNSIDGILRELSDLVQDGFTPSLGVDNPAFDRLKEGVAQIATLLGNAVPKPRRWSDLHRHLHFGMLGDLHDIIQHDWPEVRAGLRQSLYGDKEPIPVNVEDLATIVSNRPRGPVATKLLWDRLSPDDFERLIFALISSTSGYENPEWLMQTNAPDRGRDLSVYRVISDALSGVTRQRIIIQCKHWLTKSISPIEIGALREQVRIWEPPRVDVYVIATSGRFTADAVSVIERQNHSDAALRIEMWPESHLERLLASRPAIIAEFNLR